MYRVSDDNPERPLCDCEYWESTDAAISYRIIACSAAAI
jgi:hypothetical protein